MRASFLCLGFVVQVWMLACLSFGSVGLAVESSEWPMHRGNPKLSGVSASPAPGLPKQAWSFKAGKAVKGGAAIAAGRVYVGDEDGVLHALELSTGKSVWSFKTEGAIEATPLLRGTRVIVGSSDGKLYSIDAESGMLGWAYETGDKILGGANVARSPENDADWILVGSYDSNLHCINASSGKAVWRAETDNYINGTPALLPGGEVIFGGCDAQLRIVSLVDGRLLRQIEADAYVASSVAVADDGKAYVGHYGNVVMGMDPKEAKVLWRYRDRNFPYLSSAAVGKDRVLIGGNDKRLHCMNREDGAPIWQFSTRGKVDSSPVICGDAVVVGSMDGRIYCVSLNDGRERWVYELGAPVVASPAVVDGWIVIGAEDGAVYGLQTSPAKP